MKQNSSGIIVAAIVFFIIGIIAANWYLKRQRNRASYFLPTNNPDPTYFGPYYWKTFHEIAERIPCPACQSEAVELISFVHDYVNYKLDKPIFDEDNFKKWLSKMSDIHSKYEPTEQIEH